MAVLTTNGLSGLIGKQLVFKPKKGKTIVSAYAESRKKKGTELQILYRNCFKRAQKRASKDCKRKEIIAACSSYLRDGQVLYHFLVGLYQREEVQVMRECRNEYKSLEELLKGEPKRRKKMICRPSLAVKTQNNVHSDFKSDKKIKTIWSYPVKKPMTSKAGTLQEKPVKINKVFYGGWISTYSGG
jgi:hypothetical protein